MKNVPYRMFIPFCCLEILQTADVCCMNGDVFAFREPRNPNTQAYVLWAPLFRAVVLLDANLKNQTLIWPHLCCETNADGNPSCQDTNDWIRRPVHTYYQHIPHDNRHFIPVDPGFWKDRIHQNLSKHFMQLLTECHMYCGPSSEKIWLRHMQQTTSSECGHSRLQGWLKSTSSVIYLHHNNSVRRPFKVSEITNKRQLTCAR